HTAAPQADGEHPPVRDRSRAARSRAAGGREQEGRKRRRRRQTLTRCVAPYRTSVIVQDTLVESTTLISMPLCVSRVLSETALPKAVPTRSFTSRWQALLNT